MRFTLLDRLLLLDRPVKKLETNAIGYVPRGDRAIVKRLPQAEHKPGEVIIPGSQQKPLDEGIVIAVGPEIDDIEVGEHVCFLEFAGTTVEIDGEAYLSMRDQEIHGVRKAKA
jgi:chaperonin GroES